MKGEGTWAVILNAVCISASPLTGGLAGWLADRRTKGEVK